jgi:5-methyltetrahydrofolate--homocysteine methyltransferase
MSADAKIAARHEAAPAATSRDAKRTARIAALHEAAAQRILVLDGSWGAKIQELSLTEEDFRGERFAAHPTSLRGDTDILCLTAPDVVSTLAGEYLAAGADIITTNTFTATSIAQADYDMQAHVAEINVAGARLSREAADRFEERDGRPRWVAGSIGPTNRTLSISPSVEDPGARAVDFDEVRDAYREQALALYEGGADIFMVETIFDTLNAKAALKAILDLRDEGLADLPIWISGTITDLSGRTLSGQTVEAFWTSVRHAEPFAVGLNCALGAELMRPYLAELSAVADTLVAAHPNAGLPNEFGGYDEGPAETCGNIGEWARSGLVNIVGGCCGTTPAHIAAIADAVRGLPPRAVPAIAPALRLSGLEPFVAA